MKKIINRRQFLQAIEIAKNYSEQFLSVGWVFLLVGMLLNTPLYIAVMMMFVIAFVMRTTMIYLQVRLYVYDRKRNK